MPPNPLFPFFLLQLFFLQSSSSCAALDFFFDKSLPQQPISIFDCGWHFFYYWISVRLYHHHLLLKVPYLQKLLKEQLSFSSFFQQQNPKVPGCCCSSELLVETQRKVWSERKSSFCFKDYYIILASSSHHSHCAHTTYWDIVCHLTKLSKVSTSFNWNGILKVEPENACFPPACPKTPLKNSWPKSIRIDPAQMYSIL